MTRFQIWTHSLKLFEKEVNNIDLSFRFATGIKYDMITFLGSLPPSTIVHIANTFSAFVLAATFPKPMLVMPVKVK